MLSWQRFGSRRLLVFVGIVVLLGIVAVGVRQLSGRTEPSSRLASAAAVPVTAAVAARRDVPDVVHTIGTVQSIDIVAIQPRVNGPIVKIEFTPGQDVKAGQELFLIDPRPYQAALDQAQAQLAHDEAALKEAELDLTRYQTLARQNSIAKQQAEDQVYIVAQDKGTVALDQAAVETAKLNLEFCHIAAPISGRAGVLQIELGNLVGPQMIFAQSASGSGVASGQGPINPGAAAQTGSGSGLVLIAQMQPIYVSFPLPQTVFDKVRQNQAAGPLQVEAYSQAGKLLEKGKLTVIDNQVNVANGTVTLQAKFANTSEALWPGEFVRIGLVVSTRHNAVTVPAQTVMEGPNGAYVYVIGSDRTVHRVVVRVATRQNNIAVIESGLPAGATVVTDGQYRLTNGVKVEIQRAARPPEAVSER